MYVTDQPTQSAVTVWYHGWRRVWARHIGQFSSQPVILLPMATLPAYPRTVAGLLRLYPSIHPRERTPSPIHRDVSRLSKNSQPSNGGDDFDEVEEVDSHRTNESDPPPALFVPPSREVAGSHLGY